jgi:hypothetical protein
VAVVVEDLGDVGVGDDDEREVAEGKDAPRNADGKVLAREAGGGEESFFGEGWPAVAGAAFV